MQAEGWRTRQLLLQRGALPVAQRRQVRAGSDEMVKYWWHDDASRPVWFSVKALPGWDVVYQKSG